MVNDISTGNAIAKIILIGEHSVVYGQPAIAIPFFGSKIKAIVTKNDSNIILDCFSFNGELTMAPKQLEGLISVINEVLKVLNKAKSGFTIKIESSIPPERGMGSSAAVSAAAIRALYNFFNKNLDLETLNNLVNFSEKIVHGNPSGIDAAIVVGEKPLYYIKGKPLEQFDYSIDGFLIVSDTGEKGNTKFAVSKVRDFIDANIDKGNKIINELGELTILARQSITKNNALELGKIMTKAQDLLTQLGVSNNTIENLVKVSIENGALGAKLTGGGLGGSVITLCANQQDAIKVSKALIKNGAKNTWIMNMNYKKDDLIES